MFSFLPENPKSSIMNNQRYIKSFICQDTNKFNCSFCLILIIQSCLWLLLHLILAELNLLLLYLATMVIFFLKQIVHLIKNKEQKLAGLFFKLKRDCMWVFSHTGINAVNIDVVL